MSQKLAFGRAFKIDGKSNSTVGRAKTAGLLRVQIRGRC
jgi:hypothetical protein